MLLLVGCAKSNSSPASNSSTVPPNSSSSAAQSASQANTAATRGPRVILVMEENHSLGQVVGSSLAPQLAQIVRDGTLLTQMYATQHPSLPNYIALLSGDTHGITSDCNACSVDAVNLVDQLEAAHITWRAYMQGLPAACSADIHKSGAYAKKHDPFVYFSSIASNPQRCRNVVPYTQFAADAASGRLPQFVWVTPDLDHDMHGAAEGKTEAQLLPSADDFLGQLYRELRTSPDWKQDTRLIVTWDEGNGGQTGPHGCCNGDAVGGHIATVVVRSTKPDVRHATDGRVYDHYDLLRSIETVFGLSHLAKAGDPNSIDVPVIADHN